MGSCARSKRSKYQPEQSCEFRRSLQSQSLCYRRTIRPELWITWTDLSVRDRSDFSPPHDLYGTIFVQLHQFHHYGLRCLGWLSSSKSREVYFAAGDICRVCSLAGLVGRSSTTALCRCSWKSHTRTVVRQCCTDGLHKSTGKPETWHLATPKPLNRYSPYFATTWLRRGYLYLCKIS